MIQEIFFAILKAGLPVGIAAYLLVWWALRNEYLGEVETLKDVELEVKRLAKDTDGKKNGDPVHRKWLAFGGGFYGVMALLTLVYIELGEIFGFLADFEGFANLGQYVSMGALVGLLIETLLNTFWALAWPVYWLSDVRTEHAWIWFAAAYGGYWLGSEIATRRYRERSGESG